MKYIRKVQPGVKPPFAQQHDLVWSERSHRWVSQEHLASEQVSAKVTEEADTLLAELVSDLEEESVAIGQQVKLHPELASVTAWADLADKTFTVTTEPNGGMVDVVDAEGVHYSFVLTDLAVAGVVSSSKWAVGNKAFIVQDDVGSFANVEGFILSINADGTKAMVDVQGQVAFVELSQLKPVESQTEIAEDAIGTLDTAAESSFVAGSKFAFAGSEFTVVSVGKASGTVKVKHSNGQVLSLDLSVLEEAQQNGSVTFHAGMLDLSATKYQVGDQWQKNDTTITVTGVNPDGTYTVVNGYGGVFADTTEAALDVAVEDAIVVTKYSVGDTWENVYGTVYTIEGKIAGEKFKVSNQYGEQYELTAVELDSTLQGGTKHVSSAGDDLLSSGEQWVAATAAAVQSGMQVKVAQPSAASSASQAGQVIKTEGEFVFVQHPDGATYSYFAPDLLVNTTSADLSATASTLAEWKPAGQVGLEGGETIKIYPTSAAKAEFKGVEATVVQVHPDKGIMVDVGNDVRPWWMSINRMEVLVGGDSPGDVPEQVSALTSLVYSAPGASVLGFDPRRFKQYNERTKQLEQALSKFSSYVPKINQAGLSYLNNGYSGQNSSLLAGQPSKQALSTMKQMSPMQQPYTLYRSHGRTLGNMKTISGGEVMEGSVIISEHFWSTSRDVATSWKWNAGNDDAPTVFFEIQTIPDTEVATYDNAQTPHREWETLVNFNQYFKVKEFKQVPRYEGSSSMRPVLVLQALPVDHPDVANAFAAYSPEPPPRPKLKKVGGALGGSGTGGIYEDVQGNQSYVKWSGTPQTKVEFLAGEAYRQAGMAFPQTSVIRMGGKLALKSEWVDGLQPMSMQEMQEHPDVREGFVVDAWLANWDAVGTGANNIVRGPDDRAYRIEAGGSLLYRAQGQPKTFTDTVTELQTMRDSKYNSEGAAVFADMTAAELTAGAMKVASFTDEQIDSLVKQAGMTNEPLLDVANQMATYVARRLKNRRDFIVKEFLTGQVEGY